MYNIFKIFEKGTLSKDRSQAKKTCDGAKATRLPKATVASRATKASESLQAKDLKKDVAQKTSELSQIKLINTADIGRDATKTDSVNKADQKGMSFTSNLEFSIAPKI